MTIRLDYERDGNEIYRQSFATIRAEADLGRFDTDLEQVVVRMIHAVGDITITDVVEASDGAVGHARTALEGGAPILCDVQMVARGVTRSRLPADNDVVCLLNEPEVRPLAEQLGTTRTAAGVELWKPQLDGAVVVFGNAPTALFHLLEMILNGGPRPAAILGVPVGFIGSAESKEALATLDHGVPFITVHGRRGGSAIAAATVNAVATRHEIMP